MVVERQDEGLGSAEGIARCAETKVAAASDEHDLTKVTAITDDAGTDGNAVTRDSETADGGSVTANSTAAAGGVVTAHEAVASERHVEIVGTSMNGSLGVVDEYLEAKARWKVRFASGVAKNFKLENLKVVKPPKVSKRRKAAKVDSEGTRSTTADSSSEGRTATPVGSSIADFVQRIRAEVPQDASQPTITSCRGTALETVVTAGTNLFAQISLKPSGNEASSHAAYGAGVSGEAVDASKADHSQAARTMNLAGHTFNTTAEIVECVQKIQRKLEENEGSSVASGILEGEDRFLLFHLLLSHPMTAEKLKRPLKAIRYGTCPQFPQTKCFILVFTDGIEEAISWRKCVKELELGASSKNIHKLAPAATKKRKRESSQDEVCEVCEASRVEVGLKLLGEEAIAKGFLPPLARWEYPLLDERRRCFAGYLKCPLDPTRLRTFYEQAHDGTTWDQPVDPRSGEVIPRRTAWMVSGDCTCTYCYGGVNVKPQRFPRWMEEVMQVYMPLCGIASQEQWPNCCNLNLYNDGSMGVGWHADDEKLFQGKFRDIRILSVSLGATRTFELRPGLIEGDSDVLGKHKMNLHNGDVCSMEGLAQKHYQHRVPKEVSDGPRINLTWRWIIEHRIDCPCAK
jgi:alkylated DNA repair dioxygenase AlkB